MVDFRLQTDDEPDDDEVAAVLAAVRFIVDSEGQCEDACIDKAPVSNWKKAGLLEGVGLRQKTYPSSSQKPPHTSWRTHKFLSMLVIAASLASLFPFHPAQADNGYQTSDDMSDAMPPVAPSLTNKSFWLNQKRGARGLTPPTVTRPGIPQSTQAQATPVTQPNDLADCMPQVWPDGQQAPPKYVRVALSMGTKDGAVSLPDGALLKDVNTGEVLADLPPQSSWHVALKYRDGLNQLCFSGKTNNAANSRVLLANRSQYRTVAYTPGVSPNNMTLEAMPASLNPQFWLPADRQSFLPAGSPTRDYALVPPADSAFGVNGKLYRGSLVVKSASTAALNLINYVGLEDYVLSVVPSEMPSGWPLEALKAQAIAARSYVVASLGKHDADGYDVKPTDEDQVYSGVASESDNSNVAVAQTAGQVMKYDGQVITAYFHSTSGGCTEVCENVWNRPVPYLKAVPDYDDDSPYFSWNRRFSTAQVESLLAKNGRGIGGLLAIVPVQRGVSPRVRWLMASGTAGSVMLSGEDARRIFSLPSSCFNVGGGATTYVFAGRGFGHGLGMSQWGAKKLAEAGYTASQILSYYYKDVAVDTF